MGLKPWKRLSGSVVSTNPWWTYRRDEFELPSGTKGQYHYVHTAGSAMVIPVLDDGRILMVNQYRYLCNRESIEFPCGSVKEGSTHDDTARQELVEETGYEAETMLPVGEFNPYNGVTDEICRVYIARALHHVGASPDETEEFEFLTFGEHEIDEKIGTGEIWDGMSLAAWVIAHPALEIRR